MDLPEKMDRLVRMERMVCRDRLVRMERTALPVKMELRDRLVKMELRDLLANKDLPAKMVKMEPPVKTGLLAKTIESQLLAFRKIELYNLIQPQVY
jgi:hypothetical protein